METFLQGHMDGLLVAASWVERLREELGLEGVHQVWGEVPTWYLWLADSPGAYCLEMVDVSRVGDGLINGSFAVKFYPALDSEFFQALPPPGRSNSGKAPFLTPAARRPLRRATTSPPIFSPWAFWP